MGLGVLAKGPVACLYVLPPFMFGPLWAEDFKSRGRWYAGMALAFLAALVPVMAWLVPVLRDADNNFAFWLVWEQTAGRISGNFNDAHARPFYFYLPLLPVMAMPWIFFPSLWRGRRLFGELVRHESGMRFLLCWLIPVFVCFCLISGKQPHYLVPLLPGVAIMLAVLMTDTGRKTPGRTLAALCVLVVAGQAVAGRTALVAYDLRPVASYVQAHPEHEYAFVRNYHAEIGFLARMEKPVADLTLDQVPEWLAAHPDGLAIIRYRHDSEVAHYTRIMDMPYRGKRLGIFAAGAEYP
jgi:4-amino-4-deoxy-L-arabinose transferase-like glycosyltransferase